MTFGSSKPYRSYRDAPPPLRRLRRFVGFVILIFLFSQGVTTVLVQSVVQRSAAMEPGLEPGDRLLAFPLAYGPRVRLFGLVLPGFGRPERGDLVLVRPGYVREPGFAGRLADPFLRFFTLHHRRIDDGAAWDSSLQIKRLIGLPGDTVRIERFVAYVRPAGELEYAAEFALSGRRYEIAAEDRPGAWEPLDPFGPAMEEIVLGDNDYFVLSDDRSRGLDSRHWGPIAPAAVVSRVSLRYWPLSRVGVPP